MNDQDIRRLQSIAGQPKSELHARIRALEDLARAGGKDLLPYLQELWRRPRPAPSKPLKNWDPIAAERVVDLYIILALYKSGDASLLPEIATRVGQAGRILQGSDDELRNAAKVIGAIGRPEVVHQVIALAGGNSPEAVANAIRTLQLLNLPSPASGGPVSAFPELNSAVSFTIHRFREEIESIVRLSKGLITISNGVRERIAAKDYDRGEVKRQDTNLAGVLTQDLDMLDLTYSVTDRGVVIITFADATPRWQRWWKDHASHLRI